MNNNWSTRILRVFIVTMAGAVLALAAFGIGVSVGAAMRPAPSPAVGAPAQAPCPTVISPISPGTGLQSPEIRATPAPVPTKATPTTPPRAKPTAGPLDVELFNEAWKLLREQFYGDLPEGEEITYAAIRGLLEALGDEHTAFLTPKQAEIFNSDMQGQFEGIGARVSKAEGGGVEIKYLFDQQPAQKAGLRVGDVIIAVDGTDVTKMDLNDAILLIRGPRGTQVTLTIRRGSQPPFDVTITRTRIEIPVVETKTLADGKIEYIALSEFSNVAPQRLAEALQAAIARKPVGLILDLRGNPGGLLDAAVRIGSYFVPEGNILIERFKDRPEQVYRRQGRYLLGDMPLVVLVDGGSASASEIVAGAIQDAGTGILIGEKTYGKGSVQLPNRLSDGSQLRVTIARWYTPKGHEIHQKGLEPDIVVPITEEDIKAERDPQLERAIEHLLKEKATP
ncbi:MAG: S41 family peptidase [Anaerolineae bacterium]